MSFHWPYALFALPFVLAGLLVLFAGSRRARERLLGQFCSLRLLPLLLVSHSPVLRRLKQGLIAAGVLLAVFALARPQWGYDWQELSARGVDVVFVIDTSRSMLSQDVLPSRLERAKLAIYDCVEKMTGNRVGLVAFAGDAFLQCPLTLDYDAFRQTLEAVDTNTIAEGGTDIGVGLDVAAKALEDSGNHKIIVLLTDGEDLEGQGVTEAQALAGQGVTIYTVGVGTPAGEIIPILNASGQTDFVRDERGEIVKSHLDATTLTQIASATKGFYEPLGATGEGLAKVYDEGIKKMPEQNLTSQMRRLPIERFQWFLAAAFVLLAVEMLLSTRRPNWRRSTATVVNLAEPIPVSAATVPAAAHKAKSPSPASAAVAGMFLLAASVIIASRAAAETTAPVNSTPADAAATSAPADTVSTPATPKTSYSAKDAETLFQKGNYPQAADAYGQAAVAAPQDSRFRYDQGESLYRSGDFEGAAQAFSKTLASNDLTLQQRAYYDLGNAHYRLGQSQMKDDPNKTLDTWESALKDYQNALDLNASDADARYNLGFAKTQIDLLKKKMEQQQQQQNKNQQNQDQKNQDQQKQNQNQQNQNNSPQNQNNSSQNQQNQNQQNQSNPNQNQSDQNPQNSPGNQGQEQQNQNPSGSPKQNNPSNSQNQQNGQNSPNQNQSNPQNGGSPKPQNGTGDQNQSPQNQPGGQQSPVNNPTQPQPGSSQSSAQKPGDQGQSPQAGGTSGQQPKPQNQGQQGAQAQAGGSAGPGASGQQGDATANGGTLVGVMTRDEARQLLDSIKVYERKMPAAPAQGTAAKDTNPDKFHKDW